MRVDASHDGALVLVETAVTERFCVGVRDVCIRRGFAQDDSLVFFVFADEMSSNIDVLACPKLTPSSRQGLCTRGVKIDWDGFLRWKQILEIQGVEQG